MTAKSVIALDTPTGDTALDAALPEMLAAPCKVVTLVGVQLVGPAAWSACLPAIRGMASTSSSNTTESCRLAPVTQNISGMPCRSVTRWRLLPSLPLSVGLGPGYEPPGLVQADPAEAAGASTSCRCQSPVPRGRCSRGVPVRNTNKMPLRASSSFSRGRPPCGDFEPQAAA